MMISSIGGSSSWASTMMASGMRRKEQPDSSQMAEEMFSSADVNGDGVIDADELATALKSRPKIDDGGQGPSADELFAELDADGDGSITEQELGDSLQALMEKLEGQQNIMAMMAQMGMAGMTPPPDSGQKADELFDSADANRDGVVDADELAAALGNRQKAGNDEGPSADELFATLDADGDGSITRQEHNQGLQAMRKPQGAEGFSSSFIASALQQYQNVGQGALGALMSKQLNAFA